MMTLQNQRGHLPERWIPSAIPFFMFGFVYYLITPYFSLLYFSDNSLIGVVSNYMDLDYFNSFYVVDVVCILVSWLFGYAVSQRAVSKKTNFLNSASAYRSLPRYLFVAFFFLFIAFAANAILRGAVLFSGYASYDIAVLGPLATLIYTVAFFYNYFSYKTGKLLFFLLFLVSSLLLLGFGSRMFFVLGSITIILGYISSNPKVLKSLSFYALLVMLFVLALGVGIWRSPGENQYSFEDFRTVFLVEPLFISITGPLYFENYGGRPLFNFPADILASVINFIPSLIFPSKLELIVSLTYDPLRNAPFGGESLISKLYSNFGMFYPLFMFSIGAFYGFVRAKSYQSNYFRAVYFSVLPLLMFYFFREGFITVIKALFFNGFILPLLIIVSVGFLFKANKVINPVLK